ncbi:alpha/beta fold hydrolase [Labedaea rhizosphaerae]|uniref:Pimeloyl-ACP methyl ester carboxylesterase n=1 Tax=Labedaea rhizosphaerae TaxID=598644 RepID=A0A4R6SB67_LABRH|nr:alpha/beta hydrolase [Labedaea rhizosphaerae]TDP96793.1 pimeloyl-ACP methyl ester carboxylesterase [Labedaea rhizosphaerae]
MNTTMINGATIGWTDTGDGDVTLLLHAGVFEAWFKPLADRLDGRVIRMARAGYAGGVVPSGIVDMAGHAAHAAALLELLGAGPATVVGHSSSSAIALQLAQDRPELVSRLVLCEPPLIDALVDPADLAEVRAAIGPAIGKAMHAMGSGDLPAAFDAFMSAVCGPGYRAVLIDALGPDGLAQAERDAGFFFTNEMPAVNGWTPVDLASITAPTLFVQGGASPQATHRMIARLAATRPDAHVATLDGANHLLPLTHAAELKTLLGSWETTAAPDRSLAKS